jgi:ABC-type glycerol-3-phosphate transport system substrate-binding protein
MFLLGCKGIPEPTPEPATITFIYHRNLKDHIEAAMAEFGDQYPHITVNMRGASAGELAWSFDGDDADVRAIFTAIVDSQQERGDFLALDSFIEADESSDVSDFYPAALQAFTIGGKVWAVPYGVSSEVILYSKELFDQYGVPYPEVGWTWDDFVRTARALRDPQADIYGFAHTPDAAGWFQWGFIHQHGGPVLDDMQNPTRATFDDPLTIEAMEGYARLYHEYGVAPTSEQVRKELGGNVDVAFANGKVGMTSRHLFMVGRNLVEPGWLERRGIVTFPRSTADTAVDIAGDLWVHGYTISSETEHPEAAWQLVAFMSRQMAPHQIAPRRSLVGSGEYEQLAGGEAAAVARDVLENGLPWPTRRFLDTTNQAMPILRDATAMIISGEMTSQEAMGWAQREAQKRIVVAPTPTPSLAPPIGQVPLSP